MDPKVKAELKTLKEAVTPTTAELNGGCFTVLVVLATIFPLAYLRGWVALKLWQWFAAPIWPGVSLTVYTMVGLSFLVTAFTTKVGDFKHDPDASFSKVWGNLIAGAVWPLVLLGGAWIWTWLAWGM